MSQVCEQSVSLDELQQRMLAAIERLNGSHGNMTAIRRISEEMAHINEQMQQLRSGREPMTTSITNADQTEQPEEPAIQTMPRRNWRADHSTRVHERLFAEIPVPQSRIEDDEEKFERYAG